MNQVCIPQNFIRPPFLTDEQAEIPPFFSPYSTATHPVNQVPVIVNYSSEFAEFISSANLGKLDGVVRYLQKYRFNINNVDATYGWTALMHAASLGHYNVIKTLLEHGAESNLCHHKEGTTALMLAASNGHTRCIEMLVGAGKADIRIKDTNDFSAAYYAIHYGHGSNKIIARLLRIQYSNGQFPNYNYQQNNSQQSTKQHQHNYSNGGHTVNRSLESPNTNYSNDRYNNLFSQQQKTNSSTTQQQHNNSLNDENDFNQFDSLNLSSDQFNTSSNSERRFNTDNSSTNLSNSLLSSTNQSLNEILNRNLPKPRPIFKQRQRRFSPDVSHQQLAPAELNGFSKDFNNHNSTMNKQQSNSQQRHSFGTVNQAMMNSGTNNQQTGLRTNSLSLDLNRPFANSFNGYSPPEDDRSSNLFYQKGLNYFQYDSSVFESPQSAKSDLYQSFSEKSKFGSGYFNFDRSLNDSLTEECQPKSRNKPRNSTFVSSNGFASNCSNNSSGANSNHSSVVNLPIHHEFLTQPSSIEELNSLECKYSELASNLDEFLHQNDLQDEQLNELFAKHDIDLYKFLSLSETDLKQIGITNQEHLATLIAGQLKFKEIIGIKSLESMNFIIYLGSKLNRTNKKLNLIKQELDSIRKENQLLKSLDNMGIYDKIEKSD